MDNYSFITEIDGDVYLEPEDYEERFVSLEMVFELYTDPEMGAGDVARMVGIDETDVVNAAFYWTEEPGVYEELAENANLGPETEIFTDNEESLNETLDEGIDDIVDRSVEEEHNYNPEHVEYSGPVGQLQDLVEEQVDQRNFEIRYTPDEEKQHRSVLEMHVLTDSDSEEEAYFGADGQVFFIGSTVSEADKEFIDPEDAEEIIKQELNTLFFSEN